MTEELEKMFSEVEAKCKKFSAEAQQIVVAEKAAEVRIAAIPESPEFQASLEGIKKIKIPEVPAIRV